MLADLSKMLFGHSDKAHMGQEWQPHDSNHDGIINANDIPYEPGSLAAKKAWLQIEANAHSVENIAKCKALGYQDGRGMYSGKPLVPGVGPNQGDWQLLHDKLVYWGGYSPEVAIKIASQCRWAIQS